MHGSDNLMDQGASALQRHWENVYRSQPEQQLGWYEANPIKTMELVRRTALPLSARILNVGAGSSRLIDQLSSEGYTNLIASDISKEALAKIEVRTGSGQVELIQDDLTRPSLLNRIQAVDIWIDRAVLHFFTEKNDRDIYFELLHRKVRKGGYVIFAEFGLSGAEYCSGLPVFRYNKEMMAGRLGSDYELCESFDYTYVNPSGGERPYVYALFRKK